MQVGHGKSLQVFPKSNDAEEREDWAGNCAVERALRERNGDAMVNDGHTRKRKYTHFSPEDSSEIRCSVQQHSCC